MRLEDGRRFGVVLFTLLVAEVSAEPNCHQFLASLLLIHVFYPAPERTCEWSITLIMTGSFWDEVGNCPVYSTSTICKFLLWYYVYKTIKWCFKYPKRHVKKLYGNYRLLSESFLYCFNYKQSVSKISRLPQWYIIVNIICVSKRERKGDI